MNPQDAALARRAKTADSDGYREGSFRESRISSIPSMPVSPMAVCRQGEQRAVRSGGHALQARCTQADRIGCGARSTVGDGRQKGPRAVASRSWLQSRFDCAVIWRAARSTDEPSVGRCEKIDRACSGSTKPPPAQGGARLSARRDNWLIQLPIRAVHSQYRSRSPSWPPEPSPTGHRSFTRTYGARILPPRTREERRSHRQMTTEERNSATSACMGLPDPARAARQPQILRTLGIHGLREDLLRLRARPQGLPRRILRLPAGHTADRRTPARHSRLPCWLVAALGLEETARFRDCVSVGRHDILSLRSDFS